MLTRDADLQTCLPIGLLEDQTYVESDLQLEPGDRLVFVTDGMLERNAADLVLRETDLSLADDATLLVLDWHGDHGRDRDAVAGADADRS